MIKQKIILTGCTGFIGENFIKENYKDYDFYCVFNRRRLNKKYFKGSIKYDGNFVKLKNFFKKINPDIVVHLATKFLKEHKENDIYKLNYSNIFFGNQILEAMIKTNCRKLINFSSVWQNSENNKQYNPNNLYSATKEAFEKILFFYIRRHRVNCITLKIYDTYGYGDKRKKIINFILEKIKKKNRKLILYNKNQELNLTHYSDINSAINSTIKILNKKNNKRIFKTFAVRSKNTLKIHQIVKTIEQVFKVKLIINWKKGNNVIKKINKTFTILPKWKTKKNFITGLKEYL